MVMLIPIELVKHYYKVSMENAWLLQ